MSATRLQEDRERSFPLQSFRNLRDLGGYRVALDQMVRWRRVFRSDWPTATTCADLEFVHGYLGIRSVIDLRLPSEAGHGDLSHPDYPDVRRVCVPIEDPGDALIAGSAHSLTEAYVRVLEAQADAFIDVLTLLAEAPAPVLFHGSLGKDRTGLVAALLLDLLGVSDDDLSLDYALTEIDSKHLSSGTSLERCRWSAERSTIDLALRVFSEQTGGVDRWLQSRTGSGETANTLRRRYLVFR